MIVSTRSPAGKSAWLRTVSCLAVLGLLSACGGSGSHGSASQEAAQYAAKAHGLLRGTLTVAENLPPVLAQGLFARSGNYPVAIRFSTSPGDLLPDSVSTPRGMAVKVIGAKGERLPGADAL